MELTVKKKFQLFDEENFQDLERQLQESKLARNQPKLADDNDMKLLKKRNEELADEINKKNEEYKKLEQR